MCISTHIRMFSLLFVPFRGGGGDLRRNTSQGNKLSVGFVWEGICRLETEKAQHGAQIGPTPAPTAQGCAWHESLALSVASRAPPLPWLNKSRAPTQGWVLCGHPLARQEWLSVKPTVAFWGGCTTHFSLF